MTPTDPRLIADTEADSGDVMSGRLVAEPTLIDLVRELRRTCGLFDGAMPISPKQAWEEALMTVCLLRAERDRLRDQCKRLVGEIDGTDHG